MNKSIPTKLAAAIASVLMLGGCATTSGYGEPTDPINRIASSVTEAGSRVWDGTRYLFKLKENRGDSVDASEDEYMDEVDMALLDSSEYQMLDTDDVDAAQPAALDEKEIIEPDSAAGLLPPADAADLAATGNVEEPAAPVMDAGADDLFHTVAENETLWELAKMLTGNANNWRTLAEVNDLGENGSVYEGQKLRIPAALKRVPVDGEVMAQQPAAPTTEAAASETPVIAAAKASTDDQIYTVEAGESLWLLAERTTGNAENWLAIADYNGMDERAANKIRYGQKLTIPGELLIEGATGGTVASNSTDSKTAKQPKEDAANAVAKAILPSKGKDVPGIDAGKSDGARQVAEAPADATTKADESEIVTVPASFKDEPPTDLPSEAKEAGQKHLLADQAPPAGGLQDGEVMVSGTYYPKAIYNEANFSSSLLMRVSPGTRLKVAKTIGPWYEVVTDKGTGFVHSRDTN